jgi:hypothetical protein
MRGLDVLTQTATEDTQARDVAVFFIFAGTTAASHSCYVLI